MDSKEHADRFKKYDAEYKQYLLAKYFSDKTLYGGNIYDIKMNIDGQTISAGRFPPFQSFVDPAAFYELVKKESSSAVDEPMKKESSPVVDELIKKESSPALNGAPTTSVPFEKPANQGNLKHEYRREPVLEEVNKQSP